MKIAKNPNFIFAKCQKQRKKNDSFLKLLFISNFFLIFSLPAAFSQIPAKCVGSTSIQKYTGSMRPNDFLVEGQNLTSANGKYHLRVTNEGELVIERILESQTCGICNEKITMRAGKEIWKAPAGGQLNDPPMVSILKMNADCNLCFGSKQNKGWCITNGVDDNRAFLGKCDKIILTNDGRLALIDINRQEIWSNKSSGTTFTNNTNPNLGNFSDNLSASKPINTLTLDETDLNLSNSDLTRNLTNIKHQKINTTSRGAVVQDKSNLDMGTYVCLNLSDGTTAKAMIVGEGLYYGPRQDSYAIDIVEGTHRGQRFYLKPYQIDRVGECAEVYIPVPFSDVPVDLDMELLERQIIAEINIIRSNPKAYADELANLEYTTFGTSNNMVNAIAIGNDLMMKCYDGSRDCQNENRRKLQTAINYLRSINKPLPLLKINTKLSEASVMLAADKGNLKGNVDSQGRTPACRAESVGYPSVMMGECLNSGYRTAAAFVISFLNSPFHRNIIMNESANEIGVDVHRHASGKSAFLRNVIMMGNSNYADSPGSCN